MARQYQHAEETRAQALREAVTLFLDQGYHATTLDQIASRIGRTRAGLLRAFPDKEAVLYALVTYMFGTQFDRAESLVGGTEDPVLIYGVETALQLHVCEISEPLRDIYVAAYTLPTTSDYIYRTTAAKLGQIFSSYLPSATEGDYYELEIASGSVMRGFMAKPCDMYFTIDRKVERFLQCCLRLYDVPEAKRDEAVKMVLSLNMAEAARLTVADTVRLAHAGFGPEVLRAGASDVLETSPSLLEGKAQVMPAGGAPSAGGK